MLTPSFASVISRRSSSTSRTSSPSRTPASKLLRPPEIFKQGKNNLLHFLELSKHNNVLDKYYLPWYLQQTTQDLARLFQVICKAEDQRIHEGVIVGASSRWSLKASAKSYDEGRSRYTNVFPFDKNRVKLPVRSTEFSDYINASYVNLSLPEISRFNRRYIAAQGPLEGTVPHFWQMCYNESDPEDESKPIVIVMVTSLTERGTEKCYKYWPDGTEYTEFMLDTQDPYDEGFKFSLRLTLKDSHDNGSYVYSRLLLTPELAKDTGTTDLSQYKPKVVHHFYYDKWSDFSKPDGYADLLSLSQSAWKLNGDKNLGKPGVFNDNPIYVHCSAGVGRSGTFITLDYLLNYCNIFVDEMKKVNPKEKKKHEEADRVNPDPIFEIVSALRTQRMMLVQSRSQFLFIYDTAETVYQQKVALALEEDEKSSGEAQKH